MRNVAALEVPAQVLGLIHLKAGDEVELAVTLETNGLAYKMEWRGRFRLRE